jgi:hypothetical protein
LFQWHQIVILITNFNQISGRHHLPADEKESSGKVGSGRVDLARNEAGGHGEDQQAGWKVSRIRDFL